MRNTSPVSIVLLDVKFDQAKKLPELAASKIATATIVPQSPVAVGHSTAALFVDAELVVVNAQLCRA
jgi:hypothetical protein